jgi:hypothetical protein
MNALRVNDPGSTGDSTGNLFAGFGGRVAVGTMPQI